jgi:integrase
MPLTETAIKHAKARTHTYRLTDGRGLTLLVQSNGAKLWRFRFKFDGREGNFSLGQYPDTTLAHAREKRDDARKLIAAGINPSERRKEEKARRGHTFKIAAVDYLAQRCQPQGARAPLSEVTMSKAEWMLESFVYPHIGSEPIANIKADTVRRLLLRIEANGFNETARRTKQLISRVFRYAVAHGLAEYDVTTNLKGVLAPVVTRNHPAITEPRKIGELLRSIEAYSGEPAVQAALKLAPLVFVRPGELRSAEWIEFDLLGDEPTWRIPAHKMKMRREHIVPLSAQAAAIVGQLKALTGKGRFLFPSLRSRQRCMSETTMNAALRRLGYSADVMTPHGFRTLASTRLNELGYNADLIELQLAHKSAGVRAVYNKAERLAERRTMMQQWADHLDTLKDQVSDRGG